MEGGITEKVGWCTVSCQDIDIGRDQWRGVACLDGLTNLKIHTPHLKVANVEFNYGLSLLNWQWEGQHLVTAAVVDSRKQAGNVTQTWKSISSN